MDLLPRIEIHPKGPVRGTVIWLHGLGASGDDFVPIVPHLGLEGVRFVFPHAPEAPVTANGGMVMPSWYDIRSFAHGPHRESEDDIRASAKLIEALLDHERTRDEPTSRIVLAGFSQGGALALHVGHRYPHALAGIMVLSGYLLLADAYDSEGHAANAQTPIFFGHGRFDDVVPPVGGQTAAERTRTQGREITYRAYDMGHQVCAEEVRDIGEWLRARFA